MSLDVRSADYSNNEGTATGRPIGESQQRSHTLSFVQSLFGSLRLSDGADCRIEWQKASAIPDNLNKEGLLKIGSIYSSRPQQYFQIGKEDPRDCISLDD